MVTVNKKNSLRISGQALLLLGIILMMLILPVSAATVEENAEAIGSLQTALTVVWLIICGGIVFLMHAGFSLVEIGLTRVKNTANIPVSYTHLDVYKRQFLQYSS